MQRIARIRYAEKELRKQALPSEDYLSEFDIDLINSVRRQYGDLS